MATPWQIPNPIAGAIQLGDRIFGGNSSKNLAPQNGPGDLSAMQSAPPAAAPGTTVKKKWTPADWEDALQKLFERLNKGLDFNDPRTQAILNNARASTMQSTNDRGIFGGYSENAAEGSYIGAASKLQADQDAMALQALGMGANYSRGLANDAYGRAMDEYGRGEDEAGGFGALLGGGLGALGGALLGGLSGGGIPGAISGAKGGFDFGSHVGTGVGQMAYNNTNPRPTYGGYGG